ncbi:apolipoprotein N-acyltransferase [Candidatus Omnitrophota bacterium]
MTQKKIPKKNSHHLITSYLLAGISGILLALPFHQSALWLMSWIGLVPLFIALENKSLRQCFRIAYFSGLVFFSCVLFWLIHVTLLGLLLLGAYLALYFGIFGCVVHRKLERATLLLVLPCAWVVLEFLRSTLLTGFNWALLGHSHYTLLPLIQIADTTGVYGISFIVVFINCSIYLLMQRGISQKIKLLAIGLSFCMIIACCTYGAKKLQSHVDADTTLQVSVIQGNIPQEVKWLEHSVPHILKEHTGLTYEAAEERADLIIWPESSMPGLVEEGNFLFDVISDLAAEVRIPLVVGAVTGTYETLYNSALLVSADGEVVKKYDKLHLVPFGEYIPLKKVFAFVEHIAPAPIGSFNFGDDYVIFTLPEQSTQFAVLICFEDTLPYLSRNCVRRGADFLVNITNDAWFKKTVAATQHMQASVFRAIENHRPVIRAANTGISCFIDRNGKITSRVTDLAGRKDIFISGYKTDKIIIGNRRLTFYTQYADVFVAGCGVLAVMGLAVNRRRKHS